MHTELAARITAALSCLSAVTLFATSMAIVAINVGAERPSMALLAPPAAKTAVAVKLAEPDRPV
jgi:hypothetical protein